MIMIFVLDRGFVVAGEAEVSKEFALHWKVTGKTIRIWGTTEGLAELKDGPLKETKLDTVTERFIPFRSVIEMLVPTKKGVARWKEALSI